MRQVDNNKSDEIKIKIDLALRFNFLYYILVNRREPLMFFFFSLDCVEVEWGVI